MSFAEFEALPEQRPYLEYLQGRVVQKPVAKRPHWKAEAIFSSRLLAFVQGDGGAAGPEASIYFDTVDGTSVLVPDVAYWSADKPQGDDDRSLPPTLAIEIRSKDQALSALLTKCRFMRAHGVDVCWLADPLTSNAYIFEGDRDGEPLGEDGVLSSGLLPGFRFPLAELWALIA